MIFLTFNLSSSQKSYFLAITKTTQHFQAQNRADVHDSDQNLSETYLSVRVERLIKIDFFQSLKATNHSKFHKPKTSETKVKWKFQKLNMDQNKVK